MRQITQLFFQKVLIIAILIVSLIGNAQVFGNGQAPGFSESINITCASNDFNTFDIDFSFIESGINSSNEFIVQLSAPDGDFSNAIDLVTQSFTSSPVLNFPISIPTDAAGDNYRIRIISTDPPQTSGPSPEFQAYFLLQTADFSINNGPENNNGIITFCPGTSIILEVDEVNVLVDGATSPRDFENSTYNWFREIAGSINQIGFGIEEPFFEVDEEGIYFAEVNYGDCPNAPLSNEITALFASGDDPANATITSSLGNPFCSDGSGTTLSTNAGDTYEWFLNEELITGETGSSIQATQSGDYFVIITTGGCEAVGSIQLENLGGTTTIDVPAVSFVEIGTPVTATVTTTLDNPQFEWFLNDQLIDGATENVFTATAIGTYSVVVTSTGDCDSVTPLFFELSALVDVDNIPNTVSPNGDGINDIWMIPAQYVSGTNTEIVILSSAGETVLQTNDYTNNWPESIDALGNGNQVFYYTISPQSDDMIIGSITVIK